MTRKICFFTRSSIHYRKNIWMLMDQELPCDFYFGDSRPGKIEPIDTALLTNFKGYFHNINIGRFYWQKGALRLLRSDYTDIITQGDTYSLTVWALLFLARFYKKRVFLWTHGAYGDENGFKRWLAKLSKKKATGVFLYGEHAKRLLVNWGVPEEKLHLIYNSLDYDQQLPLRQSFLPSPFYQEHFGNGNPNIVFIGRLTKVKKLDQLLRAAALLKKKGVDYNITFVGDGSERQQLKQMVGDLGLTNQVWFYGACYDERRIAELLYNADLCVSPGNVGLTAMHAMTFGCPVISNDNFSTQMPEFEAIEDGKTGTFFKENDIESLAEAISRWRDSSPDRELVRKACYKVIDEKYNPHLQLETLKKVIYYYNK